MSELATLIVITNLGVMGESTRSAMETMLKPTRILGAP